MAVGVVDVVTEHLSIVKTILFKLVQVPGICIKLRSRAIVSHIIAYVELSQCFSSHVHVESLFDTLASLHNSEMCILTKQHATQ